MTSRSRFPLLNSNNKRPAEDSDDSYNGGASSLPLATTYTSSDDIHQIAVRIQNDSRNWPERDRKRLALEIFTCLNLSTQSLDDISTKIYPLVHRDFSKILPPELAVAIFSFLPYDSLARASRVCKLWCDIITNTHLWQLVYLGQGWSIRQERVDQFEQVQNLELRNARHVAAKTFGSPVIKDKSALLLPDMTSSPFYFSASLYNKMSTIPGNMPPRLDWRYLFAKRYELERNWNRQKFFSYIIPPSSQSGTGHTDCIYTIQFDRRYIVSGSKDHTVKVWDIEYRNCIRTLRGHTASVLCIQFDADKDTIMSGSTDKTIKIWNFSTGQLLATLQGHRDSVLSVKFNDEFIVSSSKDDAVVVWNRHHPYNFLRKLEGHTSAVNAVQLLDDKIVSVSGDKTVRLWNARTGQCLLAYVAHTRGIACVQYDGRMIITGSSDKSVKFYDTVTNEITDSIPNAHFHIVRTLQADKDRLITGSYDESIKIWRKRPIKNRNHIKKPPIESLAIAPSNPPTISSASSSSHSSVSDGSQSNTTINNNSNNNNNTAEPTPAPVLPLEQDAGREVSVVQQESNVVDNISDNNNDTSSVPIIIPREAEPTHEWVLEGVFWPPHWVYGMGRFFKLQFDARRLIACSQDNSIVVFDFGTDIDGIDDVGEFF